MQNSPVNFVDPYGLAIAVNKPPGLSFPDWVPSGLADALNDMMSDPSILPLGGMAQGGGNFAGKTVKEILKGKRGCIKNAPLPKGAPSWDDILDMTLKELQSMLNNSDAWKTIKKLLTDKRFDK